MWSPSSIIAAAGGGTVATLGTGHRVTVPCGPTPLKQPFHIGQEPAASTQDAIAKRKMTAGGGGRYRDLLCNQSSLEPTSPASFTKAASRSRS